MAKRYDNNFKNMIVNMICVEKQSTSKTAEMFDVPLKTIEKWVMFFYK